MDFTLDIIQKELVKKTKPGVVRVYDYYNPGNHVLFMDWKYSWPNTKKLEWNVVKPLHMYSSLLFQFRFLFLEKLYCLKACF